MMVSYSDDEDEFTILILKQNVVREYCLNVVDQTIRYSDYSETCENRRDNLNREITEAAAINAIKILSIAGCQDEIFLSYVY